MSEHFCPDGLVFDEKIDVSLSGMCTVDPTTVTTAPTNLFDTEVSPIIRIEPAAVSRLQ